VATDLFKLFGFFFWEPAGRGSVGGTGDFVCVGVDAGDDLIGLGGADADGGESFEEVACEAAEVGGGDAAAMVDGCEGFAGIGDGAAEGHGEELALHGMEGVEAGVAEEGGEIGVCQDPGIEGGDEGVNEGGAAEAFVEGGHGEGKGLGWERRANMKQEGCRAKAKAAAGVGGEQEWAQGEQIRRLKRSAELGRVRADLFS
jgi:hypothetical protein